MKPTNDKVMDLIFQLKKKCIQNELIIMQEAQLSQAEYNGIVSINLGEVLCGADFSKSMNLSPSRASRVVDKLVQRDFLIREGDPADRRRCQIRLSEKGAQIRKKIENLHADCEKKFQEHFARNEIEHFTDSLKRTLKIL
jgi:DNA-binding MarR family transcriptional regulator